MVNFPEKNSIYKIKSKNFYSPLFLLLESQVLSDFSRLHSEWWRGGIKSPVIQVRFILNKTTKSANDFSLQRWVGMKEKKTFPMPDIKSRRIKIYKYRFWCFRNSLTRQKLNCRQKFDFALNSATQQMFFHLNSTRCWFGWWWFDVVKWNVLVDAFYAFCFYFSRSILHLHQSAENKARLAVLSTEKVCFQQYDSSFKRRWNVQRRWRWRKIDTSCSVKLFFTSWLKIRNA